MPSASSIHTAMYGLRERPPLEVNVQDTVACALAGNSVPDVLAEALEEADAVAVAVADGDAEEAELAGTGDVDVPVAQPTVATIAAAESPPRNALRVTAE